MAKLPKWKKDFNKRMAAQLREFAKTKDKPERLTKLTYTNGKVVFRNEYHYRSSWGRKSIDYRKGKYTVQQWVPNRP